ncbi:hypothetical protein JCM8202_000335 [Rhodotorula sphaerocarpa]
MFDGQTLAVIGGEGFLGHRLVEVLAERYPQASIVSLDIVQRHFSTADAKQRKPTFRSADLTSPESLAAAFEHHRPHVVFHTASPWTGSGKDICEKVNVEGTRTVVEACQKHNVARLVFTSSAGTVYDGVDLINVDERMPFPEQPIDPYNETKAKAEQIVLEANGKDGLLTIAIRPAGIFGPGDRQAIPGVMEVLKSGKTKFQVGSNQNLFDWTYVDNVVHAHLLAAEKIADHVPLSALDFRKDPVRLSVPRRQLPTSQFRPPTLLDREVELNPAFENVTQADPPVPAIRNRFDPFADSNLEQTVGKEQVDREKERISIAGQAYFVTNGEPTAFWDFPRAVWNEYNGHVAPWTLPLPPQIGLMVAALGEGIAYMRGKTPNMTQGKVIYSTVNRFYNIEKARRILGYEPIVGLDEGIKRAVAWYKENESTMEPKKA